MLKSLFGVYLICKIISSPSFVVVGDFDDIRERAYVEGFRIRTYDIIRKNMKKVRIGKKFCKYIKDYIKENKEYFLYKYKKKFPFLVIESPSYILKLTVRYGIKTYFKNFDNTVIFAGVYGYWKDIKDDDKDDIKEYVESKIDIKDVLSGKYKSKIVDNLSIKLFMEVMDEIW